ncbi:triacylglycerol lipase [Microbacterium sp. p3-SID336]|uniref:esterase/lipase family protein n=1 Tax=Microbacterium sp. p3-SID336 TaxID=2916212 RepID=UPI0021A670EA|nr:alpha/beta hydrolase [Microbacterium sp. p3-SID336]MCT1476501.1 alpha/beta hydrolase [Microbacterium sp. p3-SID336]
MADADRCGAVQGRECAIDALKRLGWWAADYAYAGFWQVRSFFGRSDPAGFATGAGVPIVVLAGVYETWRFLEPLVVALHDRGHPVYVVDALRRNRFPVVDEAQQIAAFLRERDLSGVILVAHSKGGLAGKLAMTAAEGWRIRSMLAVATPFGGSRYARRMPGRVLRAFAPDDPSIVALAREIEVNARIVSVYAEFDPHIPEGSELPGAKNVVLGTGGHFRILAHPRVLAELAVLAES